MKFIEQEDLNEISDIKSRYLRGIMRTKALEYLKKTDISPEFLTSFRIAFSMLTGIFLFLGNYWISALVLTLYQFVLLLDYVDGPLARYKNIFSLGWQKTDMVFHYISPILFMSAINLSYFLKVHNLNIFLIGITGSLAIFLALIYELSLYNKRNVNISKKKRAELYGYKGGITKIYSFFGIDSPFSLFYFFIILNMVWFTILFFSVLRVLIFIKKVLLFFLNLKWYLNPRKK